MIFMFLIILVKKNLHTILMSAFRHPKLESVNGRLYNDPHQSIR